MISPQIVKAIRAIIMIAQVLPSVRPVSCPLCNFYIYEWIFIKQHGCEFVPSVGPFLIANTQVWGLQSHPVTNKQKLIM